MMFKRVAASVALIGLATLLASGAQAQEGKPSAAGSDKAAPPAVEANSVLAPSASAVEQALKQLKPGGDSREKFVLQELAKLYGARAFEPLWIEDGKPSRQALALVAHLGAAAEEGLRPQDYPLPALDDRALADSEGRAATEVKLSQAFGRFVLHLAAGRVEPGSVSKHITVEPPRPKLADALTKLSREEDAAALMRRFAPPHPQYAALRDKLAELRAQSGDDELPVVPDGPSLRLGDSGPRVALLRLRLGLQAAPVEAPLPETAAAEAALAQPASAEAAPQPVPVASAPAVFDEATAEAVRTFQKENRLTADGIVGERTLMALNGLSREEQIATIQVNMERLRWLPRDMGEFHVAVNVPEFQLRIVRDGKPVHETRVIVGTPENPTPTFSNEIDHLIVNPFWNVPSSILTKEMLPEIQRDPYGYFARHNYQVLANWQGQTYIVDPTRIDWTRVDTKALRVRQLPGEANALGRIKFMFPNQHAVYLHDTPTKHLFKKDYRAYSHGCVRVDDPMAFADALLAYEPDWDAARLQKYFGGEERRINLKRSVPVHLTYFTARVAEDGRLTTFADLYGYDGKIREQLGV